MASAADSSTVLNSVIAYDTKRHAHIVISLELTKSLQSYASTLALDHFNYTAYNIHRVTNVDITSDGRVTIYRHEYDRGARRIPKDKWNKLNAISNLDGDDFKSAMADIAKTLLDQQVTAVWFGDVKAKDGVETKKTPDEILHAFVNAGDWDRMQPSKFEDCEWKIVDVFVDPIKPTHFLMLMYISQDGIEVKPEMFAEGWRQRSTDVRDMIWKHVYARALDWINGS